MDLQLNFTLAAFVVRPLVVRDFERVRADRDGGWEHTAIIHPSHSRDMVDFLCLLTLV